MRLYNISTSDTIRITNYAGIFQCGDLWGQSLMIEIRTFRSEDFPRYRDLYLASVGSGPDSRDNRVKSLTVRMSKPGYRPERDLLMAVAGGEPVGFLDGIPEKEIGRMLLHGYTLPRYRRRGAGSSLLARMEKDAASRGLDFLHSCLEETEREGVEFLEKRGFRRVRIYLDFVLDLKDFNASLPDGRKPELRNLRKGGELLLSKIQNSVFKGSWGFCPNTKEDIDFYLRWTGSRIEDVQIMMENKEIAGYFWSHPVPEGPSKKVRIHMLGIHPRYQGRGKGKELLVAGLQRLQAEGWENVDLTVDSENTPARHLYLSLGFRLHRRMFWYEKRLNSPI